MKNLILFTAMLLSSVSVYATTCTPPNPPKCECAYPVLKNGTLACGDSYCGNKKCMPNGACCEEDKYCKVGDVISCCAENETCDTTTGCVEEKDNLETLCASAQGTMSAGGFCQSQANMSWEDADSWCLEHGMQLISVFDVCPDFDHTRDYDGNGTADWSSGGGSIIVGVTVAGREEEPCPTFYEANGWTATIEPEYEDPSRHIVVGGDSITQVLNFTEWHAVCKELF